MRVLVLLLGITFFSVGCDNAMQQVFLEEKSLPEKEISAIETLEKEPYVHFLDETEEGVIRWYFEEKKEQPEMFVIPRRAILHFPEASFTCEEGEVVSIYLREGEFLGITLGENYDESQITEILGIPDEEGNWDTEGEENQIEYMIFFIGEYQVIFYLDDELSVEFGKDF